MKGEYGKTEFKGQDIAIESVKSRNNLHKRYIFLAPKRDSGVFKNLFRFRERWGKCPIK